MFLDSAKLHKKKDTFRMKNMREEKFDCLMLDKFRDTDYLVFKLSWLLRLT